MGSKAFICARSTEIKDDNYIYLKGPFWYRGGGGQVVSVLALYSTDPSSNPAEAYSFFSKICISKDGK